MWLSAFAGILLGYLLGNLNGAVITSRLIAHEDVRKHGSGNGGLTNFVRVYGAGKALLVVLIDGGKAVHYWGSRQFSQYLGLEDSFIANNFIVSGGSA